MPADQRGDAERERGWREHEQQQRRAWLALSYRERLLWLEQAKRFYQLALRARHRPAAKPPG